MLSFKVLNAVTKDSVMADFADAYELACAIVDLIEVIYSDEDNELALARYDDCLLLRVFDMGRYSFPFPFELQPDADVSGAIDEITEYARRQEISLMFTNVPISELATVTSRFRHMLVDAEDKRRSSFSVTVQRESDFFDEIPTATYEDVTLGALCENDIAEYARLCRDKATAKYWGYDYAEDTDEEVDDEYFFNEAMAEFNRGVSITFAVRVRNTLIGEAVIYAFDGKGNAEFAIRLFAECRAQGYGRCTFFALTEVAQQLSLCRLECQIHPENELSIKVFSRYMQEEPSDNERRKFTVDL